MNIPILAIDSDIDVFAREEVAWKRHNIDVVRVGDMQEAIVKLTKEQFLFTAINADSINYLPILKVMRDISSTLIFVIAKHFTVSDQTKALHAGADVYTMFQDDTEENVQSALALLLRCNERNRRSKKLPEIITFRKLFVYPKFHQLFCCDKEIPLTKTEFDIFLYLLNNRDCILSYPQIFRKVWGKEYEENSHHVLWQHMVRLKKKLSEVPADNGFIESKRGVGYRFSTLLNK